MSGSDDRLLELGDVHASYDESQILRGLSLSVDRGTVASLVGRNGAGKTTTFRTIMGILTPSQGEVWYDGESVGGLAEHETTRRGIRLVPEERRLFPDLTVRENLQMGTVGAGDGVFTIDEAFEAFPRLDERRTQIASHLSGGEQQMLTIARALVGDTELLLLDEPTEGLAPQIVEDVIDIIGRISDAGLTILLAEQNIHAATSVADYHHIIDKGQIVFEGTTAELETDEEVQQRHLGVGVEADAGLD